LTVTRVEPGQRRTKLQKHPFRAIGCPDCHMLAGREPREQRPRHAFALVQQIRKAPAPWVGRQHALYKGRTRAMDSGGHAQGIADGLLHHRVRLICRPMRVRQFQRAFGADHAIPPRVGLYGQSRLLIV